MLWYERVLGFQTITKYPKNPPLIYVRIVRDDTLILLLSRREYAPLLGLPNHKTTGGALRIPVAGIQELHAEIAGQVAIEDLPEQSDAGELQFALCDPDGHELTFWEALD